MSIPGSTNPLLLFGDPTGGQYQVSRSLRFNPPDTAFLNRTPSVASNRRTWTWSGWIKRGRTTSLGEMFFAAQPLYICFTGSNATGTSPDRIALSNIAVNSVNIETAAVFRDFSAWFHLVVALDTTQTTSSDRVKIYVNGQLAAISYAVYPSLSEELSINSTLPHGIGRSFVWSGNDWDIFSGYLADIHFIDGQALTPSSFTEVSATTGQLIPLAYSGSFGTNGFWLKFSDNSAATAAALGNDYSGNNNDWTPNNFSVVGGPSTVTTPATNAPTTVDYLVVGGGGGGGGDLGGGGGAGGFRTGTGFSVNAGTTYTITIGAGGAGNTGSSGGTNGGDSVFSSITSTGGGGGGGDSGNQTGLTGGSGGGCSSAAGGTTGLTGAAGNTPASSSPPDTNAVQGFKGGDKVNGVYRQSSSGGGGASQAGEMAPSNSQGGKGGDGSPSSITGSPVTYAGGGGGGSSTTGGAGGAGGGGAGTATSIGTAGTVNLGGGGGGAGITGGDGAAGGSGIVIIRYTNTYADLTVGGGLTYTYANTGGYKIYSFTASATAAQSAGNDSLVDTPTSISATDTGVGGEIRGNYATWNPLQSTAATLTNGNLDCTTASATGGQVRATIAVSSGKWYWEVTVNTTVSANNIGIIKTSEALVADEPGYFAGGYSYGGSTGNKRNNASASAYGATYGSGDVIGVALDLTAGTLVFYKNGASQGTAFSSLTGEFIPCIGDGTGSNGLDMTTNFGQRAFAYTAPSGFKALCDTNLPAPLTAKPNTLMDVVAYAGSSSPLAITLPGGFSPNLVWLKCRSLGNYHWLTDTVRGTNKQLPSNDTIAEESRTDRISSFDASGFTVANHDVNSSGNTFVAWCWDAGEGSAVSNGSGSITSQVRANASAGFSVVSFTTQSSSTATVGHGLNVAPTFIIQKIRTLSADWYCYHTSIGAGNIIQLNTTAASSAGSTIWNNTAPTSTVWTLGNGWAGSYSTIAYCFAPVVGYSSFGSYTGNGSTDGPFIFTSFRPRWLLVKRTDSAIEWKILDTARSSTGNVVDDILYPDLSNAEGSNDSNHAYDFLSNGFKLRTTHSSSNASGGTYIYSAFAENPFQYARAR